MRVFVQGIDSYVGAAVRRLVLDLGGAEEKVGDDEAQSAEGKWELVGSVQSGEGRGLVGVKEVAKRSDIDQVCELARSADLVVLDTHASVREASNIVKALKKAFEGSKSLVLVSTLMTWELTPSPAPEGKEGEDVVAQDEEKQEGKAARHTRVFTEAEFHHRKPSPTFLLHKTLESQVLALAHEKLSTTVLACGVMYGAGEHHLHSFFRDSWLGRAPCLPNVNDGCQNVVPMVHVDDLAKAVRSALLAPPSSQYIVVCDDSRSTVAEIVSAVFSVIQPHGELTLTKASAPAPGEEAPEELGAWTEFKAVPRVASSTRDTEAILLKDDAWQHLQADLAFDVAEGRINELVGEEWTSKEGLVANVHRVVAEFKRARDLRPIRLVAIGPPCSGKSELCRKVASEYSLPYVTTKGATEEILEQLNATRAERARRLAALREARSAARLAESKEGDEAKESEEPEDDSADPDVVALSAKGTAERVAERVEACLAAKGGRLSNKLQSLVLRCKLLSPNCLNHGYVLDGEAAGSFAALQRLFAESSVADALPAADDEGNADFEDNDDAAPYVPAEGGAADGSDIPIDKRVAPTCVVVVAARGETLRKRASQLGKVDASTFEAMLATYNKVNDDKLLCTPLSFFEGACKLDSLLYPSDESPSLAEEKRPEVEEREGKEAESKQGDQQRNDAFENLMMYAEHGGRPFNYHPTEEELQQQAARVKAERALREESERKSRVLSEAQRKEDEEARLSSLEAHREAVEKHEAELLEARAEPLREYLLKYVMPTLSKGLVETCRVKPEDPIDYLAEYLFRNSAEDENAL